MELAENIKVDFVMGIHVEASNEKWEAVELIFEDESGKKLNARLFGPDTYKKRKKTNDSLKHVYEVICGGDYKDIEYENSFEKFAVNYLKKLNDCKGQRGLYIKVVPNGKYMNLGFEVPFISTSPDLEWGDLEKLRVDSYNQRQQEEHGQEGSAVEKPYTPPVNQNKKPLTPMSEAIKKKGNSDGELPF